MPLFTNRKLFISFIVVIYTLAVLSVWAVFSPGRVAAGLSLGFSTPFELWYDVLVFMLSGVLACYLRRESLLVLPCAVALTFLCRALVELEIMKLLPNAYFLLAAILLFSMTVTMVRSAVYWLCLVLVSPVGYACAMSYMRHMPRFADPFFYLFGLLCCITLLMSCGIAVGFLMQGVRRHILNRQAVPPAAMEAV